MRILVGISAKKIALRLLIAAGLLLLLVLLTEFGARAYLNNHPAYTERDYLFSHPAAYGNAPYYGQDFVSEIINNQMRWTPSEACNCLIPGDYTGRWFNVRDGMRVTTDAPAHPICSIYMIGDSAVWGSDLPDDLTLPSFLQRLTLTCRVFNVGMLGVGTTENLARLRTIHLKPHDIVIFYAGVVDVHNLFATEQKRDSTASLCGKIPGRLSGRAIAQIICQWQAMQPPQILQDGPRLAAASQKMAATFRANIQAARDYAHQYGAAFYNFLQPNLWSIPLTEADKKLESPYEQAPSMGPLLMLTWPALQHADSSTIDFTHIVDSLRADGKPLYFDCCHVNETGNALIAKAMWRYIGDF